MVLCHGRRASKPSMCGVKEAEACMQRAVALLNVENLFHNYNGKWDTQLMSLLRVTDSAYPYNYRVIH